MPRSKSPPRVKFYEEILPDGRLRYRVRLIQDGQLNDSTFWKERQARDYQAKLETELLRSASRTVGEAIGAYYAEKEELGTARRKTCDHEKIRVMLALQSCLNANLCAVTPDGAQAIYRAMVDKPTAKTGRPLSAASHRFYLKLVQAFFRWCINKGYLEKSPFADIRPVGRPNRGKPQLRSEEVSRYIATGIKCFVEKGNRLALAAAMLPVFGMRCGEALTRRVRDIDRGRIWRLHIDEGIDDQQGPSEQLKTDSARRVLEIPPILIPHLERLMDGRSPNEYLFGTSRDGKRKARGLLWATVRRLCVAAGVPVVCPHSMRGYYASAGVRSGALPHVVAANMGHSSFTMTAKHYAQPQAIAEAHSVRVAQVLDLEPGTSAVSQLPAEQLIDQLPTATLARIAELLAQRTITPTGVADGRSFPTDIRT